MAHKAVPKLPNRYLHAPKNVNQVLMGVEWGAGHMRFLYAIYSLCGFAVLARIILFSQRRVFATVFERLCHHEGTAGSGDKRAPCLVVRAGTFGFLILTGIFLPMGKIANGNP